MIRNILLIALVALSLPAARAAVTVTATTGGGPCYATSDGTLLADGYIVRIGYFDLSNGATLATLQTSNDFATVNSLFTPISGTVTQAGNAQNGTTSSDLIINGTTVGMGEGHILGQLKNITVNSPGSPFQTNVDLSIWVFNSANPSTATEWGIYSDWTPSSTGGWELPPDLSATVLNSNEIQSGGPGSIGIVRGSFDNTLQHMQLAAIPEPSSLLMLMGSALLIRRRRRA